MRPRRILTSQESAEILDHAVRENALAVLTAQTDDGWRTFKSRFLERDPQQRFVVLDCEETHGTKPPPLASGQYVGISFRNRSRKIMFATVVEAKGRFLVDGKNGVPAVRYRWPDSLTELQRRAYYRTPVPPNLRVIANLWPGGTAARDKAQADTLAITTGEALDLSCGGTLVQLNQLDPPEWEHDQTIGIELHVPDGRQPMHLDAYYRGTRHNEDNQLCAALQFVGLELSTDGRALLGRLARCVQKFHRTMLADELRNGRTRFKIS